MMRRGLKRKLDKILDNFEEEPDPYAQGLGDFQSAARKRESMRIKNQVNLSAKPAEDGSSGRGRTTGATWERSLQDQIHLEQQMLEGTAKLVKVCKNDQQLLEAAKRLQLGRLRLEMLRFELARLKRGRGSPQNQLMASKSNGLARPSYAGVSLSDIRIPLMWKRKDHLNDAGDRRKFAVFCIARIGSQIYDTRLISNIDRTMTDVTIDDVILFSRVGPHFELTVELYARLVEDGNNIFTGKGLPPGVTSGATATAAGQMILATPQKICRSISKAVGKKLAENSFSTSFFDKDSAEPSKKRKMSKTSTMAESEDPYFTKVGPRFDMIASATLTLEDCSPEVKSHEFYIEEFRPIADSTISVSTNSAVDNCRKVLPLFGQFCCRLAAQPYCCEEPVMTGKVNIRCVKDGESIKKKGVADSTPEFMWGKLMNWSLSLWSDEAEAAEGGLPLVQVPVTRDTCILESDNNTILVINHTPENDESSSSDPMLCSPKKSRRTKTKSVAWHATSSTAITKKVTWEISFGFIEAENKSPNTSTPDGDAITASYDAWLIHLLQHAADHRRWKSVATSPMEVYSPGRVGVGKKTSASSLLSSTASTWSLEQNSRPEKEVTFNLGRMASFNPATLKRQKRDAKKSFRRTRSKLVLMYNQTGLD